MPEEIVIRCCAPTLAGMKTGSLFSYAYTSRQELLNDVRAMNRKLSPKGLRILILRYSEQRALLYLFRPNLLTRDLHEQDAARLLSEAGYDSTDPPRCIRELIRRLNARQEFPHEIGLFLSYPPEDVRGFIENKAQNYKCVGCWKVYGDEQRAKERFQAYEKCTKIYCRHWKSGTGISQLAVSS